MTPVTDPAQLTTAEKKALETIRFRRVIRRKGGYGVPGDAKKITLALATGLERKGLVKFVIERGQDTAVATVTGQILADRIRNGRREKA